MSVGNLKDQGNKGNNFPYQLAVLQLLQQIVDNGGGGGGGGCPCPSSAQEVTLQSLNAKIDTTLSTRATEASLVALLAAFTAEDFASEATLAALSAKFNTLGQKASAASTPVVLSTEQEVFLSNVSTQVTFTAHSAFAATLTGVVGAGSVAAGTLYSVVVHNVGAANGLVNGARLVPGASRTYTAAFKKYLPAISYDATGTTFEIEMLPY